MNKDDYIKHSWTYINTTLKYLKDISGNLFIASRKADFKVISDMIMGLGILEALDLKEGEYYSVIRHTDEKMLGRYIGLQATENSYQLSFEVVSATDTRVFYRDVKDIFDVYATDLNDEYVKIEHKIMGEDDWPLYAGSPFKGKLLEEKLKGKKNANQNS